MIVQPTIVVPPNIELGLSLGHFVREGSVVRDAAKGSIVAHLNEVHVEEAVPSDALARLAKSRGTWVAFGILLTVTAGGTAWWLRRRRNRTKHLRGQVVEYRAALQAYVSAIRAQELNQAVIDRLVSAIDALVALRSSEEVQLEMSSEQLRELVTFVERHTQAVAEANRLTIEADESANSGDQLAALRNGLLEQRDIFKDAA